MNNSFFDQPILNPPYTEPKRHWNLNATGQPTQEINEHRRPASFVTPIPNPQNIDRLLELIGAEISK